ncbi:MAG: pirin family protein [Myxococcales bacterium]|nr:pirin family protein [Myxococcales bacterium]
MTKPNPSLATAEEAIRSVYPLGLVWETLDPFLFCVHHNDAYPAGNEHLGPAASLEGRKIGNDFEAREGWRMYHGDVVPGFPQHPHRGFETVTVVRRGLVDHSDSLGAGARYGGGDTQWLTAGRGIVHAEMFPLLNPSGPNPLELFQIWLNLPRANKFVDPYFSMFWRDQIPRATFQDASGKTIEVLVVAGRLGEHVPPAPPPDSWASRPENDVAIWTIKMAPGARWVLPRGHGTSNRMIYFFLGSALRVAGRDLAWHCAVSLRPNLDVLLEAGKDGVELLLLQGRPIGEPVVQSGPFVMNTPGEIQQAFRDYQRTRFGGWPWRSDGPVHGREERFARYADGRVERAT